MQAELIHSDVTERLKSSQFYLTVLFGLLGGTCHATESAPTHTVEAVHTQYTVAGLVQPAEIIVDHWGVPHIYANNHYDAFFVQGFNAARDRLWQIDLWRRRGLGLLAEVLGPAYVTQDRAARLFLYRGEMYTEWLAYSSDAKSVAEAFAAGVNAYIDVTIDQPDLLPPEFELLDYRPARWQAADLVRIRSHGISGNVAKEVRRARIICELGPEIAARWKVLEPPWISQLPPGLDPCDVPADVLEQYTLSRGAVDFAPLIRETRSDPATGAFAASGLADRLNLAASSDDDQGSNNWVIAADRTTTGRPILSNDPHRTHSVPSLRYIVHLVAPDLNVIGAGEPALPGVSIGHNERIAFGLTIFRIDQEDLYVYRARPNGTRQDGEPRDGYDYRGRIEPLTEIKERIAVKGAPDREVILRFTRHGPVIRESGNKLFALRAAWLETGMAPYFGSVEYMRAANWREFIAALNRWGAPSENQVYADVDGNIGYKPAGRFPRRRNWDGLLPVPGDGRYEWDGYWDMDALPVVFNPPQGFSATANAMNLPYDYPIAERRIGFEWSAPWRYRNLMARLYDLTYDKATHDLNDSHDLQRDYHSLLARRVIDLLPEPDANTNMTSGAGANDNDAGTLAALSLLGNWDANMTPDSPVAALWAVWFYRHLQPAVARLLAPDAASLIHPVDTQTVVKALSSSRGQEVALATLSDAYGHARQLLGDDPSRWRWGDLHQLRLRHPLFAMASGELRQAMRLAPYSRGGSANTLNNNGFSPSDFLVRSGASFRMLLDVGQWDDAEMTNAPGQSGDPRSPFYDNLLEGWANDSGFPLLFSRQVVDANQAMTITLTPALLPDSPR